jgi:hypothetical protein
VLPETATELFFGDGKHVCHLTPAMIGELERTTNIGIGALFGRLVRQEFSLAEIVETIRLGLVGGGMNPQRATELVETFAKGRPLAETLPVALSILETLWFGRKRVGEGEGSANG